MKNGGYRRANAFWTARSLADLVAEAPEPERAALFDADRRAGQDLCRLSATYQAHKGAADIPLS